jgi:hypothetical protein
VTKRLSHQPLGRIPKYLNGAIIMNYGHERSIKDLPQIKYWANEIISIAQKFLRDENLVWRGTEPFKFMILCFLTKQLEHMESMAALDGHKDMSLIARSMLDGVAQLSWANQDPNTRATAWIEFAYIHDWRLFQRREAEGMAVDPLEKEQTLSNIHSFGDKFFTKRAKNNLLHRIELPKDPYYNNWTGHTIRDLFYKIGLGHLYERWYRPLSDWSHWSSAGFAPLLERQVEGTAYNSHSPEDEVYALIIGIECLFISLNIADKQFGSNLTKELEEFRNKYESWHKTSLSQSSEGKGK